MILEKQALLLHIHSPSTTQEAKITDPFQMWWWRWCVLCNFFFCLHVNSIVSIKRAGFKRRNDQVTVAEVEELCEGFLKFLPYKHSVTLQKALPHIHLSGSMHLLLHLQQQCLPNLSPSNQLDFVRSLSSNHGPNT